MVFLLSTIAGLPAHALIVHAAVVLVPLAAVALAVTGWRAPWREAYSLPIAILAVAGGVFAFLAKQSGGPLERAVRNAAQTAGEGRVRFGDHPEQGDTAFFFAFVFAGIAAVFWAVQRFRVRLNLPAWAPVASYAVALVAGALAFTTMIVAGHSGAQLVWKDVGSLTAAR